MLIKVVKPRYMVKWNIERLDRTLHERRDFSCGEVALDQFLRTLVSQYEKRNLGRTYVAVRPAEKFVLGYYTLASGAVSHEDLPKKSAKKLPKHPIPVVLLARLAVDRSMQGKGLGAALLLDALKRSWEISASLGIFAVEVEAVDDSAKAFYEKYGFTALLDNDRHLFAPIATIEEVFAGN